MDCETWTDDEYRRRIVLDPPALDRGTYAEVFSARLLDARDPSASTAVAVKVCHADEDDDDAVSACTYREVAAYGILNARSARHVLRLSSVSSLVDGKVAISMRRCGTSLSRWIRNHGARPIPIPTILRVVRDVLEALVDAHAIGIAHRDVKLANILLSKGGARALDDGAEIFLADWGGSRVVTWCDDSESIAEGDRNRVKMNNRREPSSHPVCTMGFEAPEHLFNVLRRADLRLMDVWGAGMILGCLLLGEQMVFPGVMQDPCHATALAGMLDVFGVPTDSFRDLVQRQCRCESMAQSCAVCQKRPHVPERFEGRVRRRYVDGEDVERALVLFRKLCTLDPKERPSAAHALGLVTQSNASIPSALTLGAPIRPPLGRTLNPDDVSHAARCMGALAQRNGLQPQTLEIAMRLWYHHAAYATVNFMHPSEPCVVALYQAWKIHEIRRVKVVTLLADARILCACDVSLRRLKQLETALFSSIFCCPTVPWIVRHLDPRSAMIDAVPILSVALGLDIVLVSDPKVVAHAIDCILSGKSGNDPLMDAITAAWRDKGAHASMQSM